jgi:hypothetical protein
MLYVLPEMFGSMDIINFFQSHKLLSISKISHTCRQWQLNTTYFFFLYIQRSSSSSSLKLSHVFLHTITAVSTIPTFSYIPSSSANIPHNPSILATLPINTILSLQPCHQFIYSQSVLQPCHQSIFYSPYHPPLPSKCTSPTSSPSPSSPS